MIDVMIDLENLGIHPNGPVLTIGVCQFDIHTGEIGQELYLRIDRTKAMKYGLVDMDTVRWWEGQDPATRAEAYDGTMDPVTAAKELRAWFARVFPKKPFVWGNGSCMDIVQLEWWLRQCDPVRGARGFVYPWDYWSIMDMRTIMRVAKIRMPRTRPDWMQHHNALHDARYQVEWVSKAMGICRNKGLDIRPMPQLPDELHNISCD